MLKSVFIEKQKLVKMKCCVKKCSSKYIEANKKKFFSFPNDKTLQKQWLNFCGKSQSAEISRSWKVCDLHFKKDDFIGIYQCELGVPRKILLKTGAVPSILRTDIADDNEDVRGKARLIVDSILKNEKQQHENNVDNEKSIEQKKKDIDQGTVLNVDNDNDCEDISMGQNGKDGQSTTRCDCENATQVQIRFLKNKLQLLQNENDKLIKTLRSNELSFQNTLAAKNLQIKHLQLNLRKSNSRCNSMEARLKEMFTEGQILKLQRGNRRQNWTAEDIASSITLYSASPKGYRLMRKRNFPLPAIRTLQSWAQKIDISPGILQPVVQILSAATHMTSIQKLCVLSFDEMKIRKSDCYDKPANYVQVAMIRGLVADWKQPIFYDYDYKMTESTLKAILKTCEEIGFIVVAVVSNLDDRNCSLMFKELNVSYENPWFSFEERKIYVFADVPHLIKLLRNHFIEDGFVINEKLVNKDIIAALLEETAGDLSFPHNINLKNVSATKCERQEVNMATKLFSNTVAQAIKRAASFGYLNGTNWKECHELFKITNDWFDVLNVRVPLTNSRGGIHAYGLSIDIQNDILDKMDNIVQSMKVGNKSLLLPFQKGILQTNNALKLLFADLQEKIKYILTYRLNQDVLENFFNLMSSKGGLLDQPDQREFKFRLRSHILERNNGMLSFDTNAGEDNIPDLGVPSSSMTGLILSSVKCPSHANCQESIPHKNEDLPDVKLEPVENEYLTD